MEASTIRIAIRSLNEPWDASRIPAVLDEIKEALREAADIPAHLTADSMTIDIATDRLPEAAAFLRERGADLAPGFRPNTRRALARLEVVEGRDGHGPDRGDDPMTTLSDIQAIVLSAASQRGDRNFRPPGARRGSDGGFVDPKDQETSPHRLPDRGAGPWTLTHFFRPLE